MSHTSDDHLKCVEKNHNMSKQFELTRPALSVPSFRVEGRCFLITGGTQGLGFAIARVLKEQGAAGLALVSRSAEKGMAVCADLSDGACHCVHVPADLANPNEASGVVARAVDLLQDIGPISGFVNAAATSARGNLFTETVEGFDRHFALNVRAPFLITQGAASHMIARGIPGSIVNIGSCAAHGGAPFVMAYSASKGALINLTKINAAELAAKRIRVNAVNMGWCCTDHENHIQSIRNPNWLSEADRGVPLGRILRPEDVACTVLFLLSDASLMMTGTVIDQHPEYPHDMISLADEEGKGR